jgi:ribosome-binding factor A
MEICDNISLLLRMRNVPDLSFREDESTHFMFNQFCPEIVIYEIMWKKSLV